VPSLEHEVYNVLSQVPEIIELHPLFEEYDLIAKIEAADIKIIEDITKNDIRSLEGVIDTKILTGK